jgi:prepilin-type processing-associated H-X9-DG protein
VSVPVPTPAETALPKAPPVSPLAATAGRSWWRRIDVLVAACLLATIGGISLMVLAKMRGPSSAALITECKNNLRQFYIALQTYHNQHGQFPDVAKETPYNVAGVVVPVLNENGTLPASASIRCAGVGSPVSCQLTLTALKGMNDAEFEQCAPTLSWCYAYSLGYRGENGAYHGPAPARASLSQTPLMADRPPPEGIANNSINHGGAGQNVLFADGHAVFLTSRMFAGADDIFANNAGKVAAGLDPRDIVLGHSAARP